MALVHNNLLSVFAGVSKQSIDLRLPNNCEEMNNIYPTVHNGLRRRNPTVQLSNNIIVEDNQFLHTYDRGLSGETSEQYAITIDATNGLRVLDVGANVYRTVSYTGNSLLYLQSSNPELGFSAITIKDTTFIANRDVVPMLSGKGIAGTIYSSTININMNSYEFYIAKQGIAGLVSQRIITNLAPARIRKFIVHGQFTLITNQISSIGATTTIIVDGISLKYTTSTKVDKYNIYPETMSEYRVNIYNLLVEKLNNKIYFLQLGANGSISIYKLDGTSISVSSSISFPTNEPTTLPIMLNSAGTSTLDNYNLTPVSSVVGSSATGNLPLTSYYDSEAFIWIKSVSPDPSFPYTFTVSIRETSGTVLGSTTTSATKTDTVATAIATWADSLAGFSSVSSGSVVKINRDNATTFEILVSDTYGNQASSSWIVSTTSMDDLPKNFPFKDSIVKIDGLNRADENAYWVKYDGKTWVEWRDPKMYNSLVLSTMPHKLVRNPDFTFTLSEQNYSDILVGDEFTNPLPDFIGNKIKDLFFVNNRFGILTSNGISLSQQGEFTNFFRTTILNLLDDSAISTYIDSNKSVGLEYATELGDIIVLFGDKQQFKLDASKGITPSTISVSSLSKYELNKNVRPISHGDSVYFISKRGNYSALMKMDGETLATVTKADDVSSHVPNYIDSDITQIVGSIRNQVIFLKSRSNKDIIYVYKSHMVDREDKQKSWGKWTFSSKIESIFSLDRYLYLFGSRYDDTVPTNEFTFTEYVDFSKVILFETYISYGAILANPSFERIDIDPYEVSATFKDNGTVRYNSEIELSEWFLSGKDGVKEVRGCLLVKTIMVSSTSGSDFSLEIHDKERGTTRVIPTIYTVDRKPFISGNSKNMRIKIKSNNGNGFQVNSISLEGQYNNRSTRTT